MALSTAQFVRRLVATELFARDELNAFVAGLDSPPENGEALAKALVKAGKLTKFQAKKVYAGDGKTLVLGNYLILDEIGAGGMGEVYLARHRRLGRKVALKVLPANVAEKADAVRRFHREVQAVAKLSHPNIVAAFDADEHKGTHYFVMNYVGVCYAWQFELPRDTKGFGELMGVYDGRTNKKIGTFDGRSGLQLD